MHCWYLQENILNPEVGGVIYSSRGKTVHWVCSLCPAEAELSVWGSWTVAVQVCQTYGMVIVPPHQLWCMYSTVILVMWTTSEAYLQQGITEEKLQKLSKHGMTVEQWHGETGMMFVNKASIIQILFIYLVQSCDGTDRYCSHIWCNHVMGQMGDGLWWESSLSPFSHAPAPLSSWMCSAQPRVIFIDKLVAILSVPSQHSEGHMWLMQHMCTSESHLTKTGVLLMYSIAGNRKQN